MKRFGWMVLGMSVSFILVNSQAVRGEGAASAAQYMGSETCAKMCHKTAKQGEQLRLWQESSHAKAFEVLGTDAAKAIGKKMGIDDPQKSDKCLPCHTTAHGVAADKLQATYSPTEGVGCERCHGPGSDYKKMAVMKDRKQAVAAGLLLPNEKTCLQCHNEKSPTYKPFKYDERVKKIAHKKPEAAPAGG